MHGYRWTTIYILKQSEYDHSICACIMSLLIHMATPRCSLSSAISEATCGSWNVSNPLFSKTTFKICANSLKKLR